MLIQFWNFLKVIWENLHHILKIGIKIISHPLIYIMFNLDQNLSDGFIDHGNIFKVALLQLWTLVIDSVHRIIILGSIALIKSLKNTTCF